MLSKRVCPAGLQDHLTLENAPAEIVLPKKHNAGTRHNLSPVGRSSSIFCTSHYSSPNKLGMIPLPQLQRIVDTRKHIIIDFFAQSSPKFRGIWFTTRNLVYHNTELSLPAVNLIRSGKLKSCSCRDRFRPPSVVQSAPESARAQS